MCRIRHALSAAVFLLVGGLALAADPPGSAKPQAARDDKSAKDAKSRPTTKEEFEALAKVGPLPPWKNRAWLVGGKLEYVHGTVTAVAEDAITIRPKGEKESGKYLAHELLITGGVCHWELDSKCYLLDDVKLGDEVSLAVGTADEAKGQECFSISIRRRPGGKIPASRKPSEGDEYHLRRQVEVDYHEKGEYTPEELRIHEAVRKSHADRGLPPPPPPDPPEKFDDKK